MERTGLQLLCLFRVERKHSVIKGVTTWYNALDPTSAETIARKGNWTKEEDSTLTDAVEKHKQWQELGCNCCACSRSNESTV
jgi:hypothetical protein